MPALNTHLDVYKLLPKTNCRDCGLWPPAWLLLWR